MGSGDFTFLKGNIETIILCALYKEDKYGYEIAKEIKLRTNNKYEIKNATLYAYLKRLEDDHLIASYWGETSNGGRRRYYSLTNIGRANCQQFISEWEYQRGVMSDLVDGTAEGVEISQNEATPLFGRRTQRRSRKSEYQDKLDEQDEIARKLRELAGETEPEAETVEDTSSEDDATAVEEVAETVVEEVLESDDTPQEPLVEVVETQTVEDDSTTTYEEEPVIVVVSEPTPAQPETDNKSIFDVQQDSAEDFLEQFNKRAREAEKQAAASEASEDENYQHVLMSVLGDQLDGMPSHTDEPESMATIYYEDHPAALEDVADSLAREGIRIRIYNHATATYKPKILIPQSQVLCQTAWLTYAFAFLYFGIFALCSITAGTWSAFVITLAILLVAPLGFSAYAMMYPTRKDKPKFNFQIAIIAAAALCVIIVLFAIGFSALGNMEFGDYAQVSKKILIPLGIGLLFPVFVAIYELLYKQY